MDDEDDLDGMDDWEDDFEEERPRAKSSKSGAGKSAKSSKKRKGSNKALFGILMIGGISVAAVALIGGVVVLAMNMGGGKVNNKIDLSYLPPDATMFLQVKVQELQRAPLLADLLAQTGGKIPTAAFGMANNPLSQNELIEFRLGATPPGGAGGLGAAGFSRPLGSVPTVIVMKFASAIDGTQLTQAPLSGTAATHNGQTYYREIKTPMAAGSTIGAPCMMVAESTLLIMAPEEEMKKVIERGKTETRRPEFDFLSTGHQFQFAVLNPNPGNVSSSPPPPPFMAPQLVAVTKSMETTAKGVAMSVGISSQVDLEVLVDCLDSSGAGNVKTSVDAGLSELKTQYEKSKNILTFVMPEAIGPADKAVASLTATTTGNLVRITGQVPGEIKPILTKLQSMAGGMGGPGGPGADSGGM